MATETPTASNTASTHQPDPDRNVLFILTDQQRVDTLGCYGNPAVHTPHLDSLAASGTRFDRWYTPTAICTPARASLLTGKAPFRHKLLANYERNVGYMEELAEGEFTFSEALRDAGYNCGLVGKWHVGTNKTCRDYGFDGPELPGWHNPVDHPEYVAWLAENNLPPYEISDHIRGTLPNGQVGNLLAARLQQPVEATFEYWLADRTIELIRQYAADRDQQGRPFFLALHYFGPHLPYLLPDQYFDMYDPDEIELPASVAETFVGKPPVQKNYSAHWTYDTLTEQQSRKLIAAHRGYVTMIDEQLGRVFAALTEAGLMESTAVFFSSDHGEFTGAHRLHDKGPAMYEDIYRTAGIVRVPGSPEGQVCNEFVSLLDSTATILEWCGLDPSPAVDSRSLLPLVAGTTVSWPDYIVCEFHGHHFPVPQRMLRQDRYKLIINPESVNELYDLEADPDELINRYPDPELAQIRTGMIQQLYRVLVARGDNFHHWMSSMLDVGTLTHDPSLSGLDDASYQTASAQSTA